VQCSAELSMNLLSTAEFLSLRSRSRKDIADILSVNP